MPDVVDPKNKEHVVPDGANADKLWEMLRDDVSLDKKGKASKGKKTVAATKAPSAPDDEIGVLVQNATASSTLAPVGGRAGTIAEELVRKVSRGRPRTRRWASPMDRMAVRYPSADLEGDAQRIAKSLGIPMSSVRRRCLRGHPRRGRRLAYRDGVSEAVRGQGR